MSAALGKIIGDFFAEERPDAQRLFHGRGQLYPGLEHVCIDWFMPVVLLTAYQEIADSNGLRELFMAADKLGQIDTIILQKRYQPGAPVELLRGDCLREAVVSEGDLRFEVHPGKQQNAGLFLDTRLLREWLLLHSRDKNVLNLFAYTCSLSVAALAGGARHVTNVDMSKTSIKWGEKNHQLNGQDLRRISSIPHNLFKSWGRIKQFGRYDLVIIDPPTRQRGSFDVGRDYGAVLKKLSKLTTPGAHVIATLNSPFLEEDYLIKLFLHHVPDGKYIEMMPVAPEFADRHRQRGLKICHFRMPDRLGKQ